MKTSFGYLNHIHFLFLRGEYLLFPEESKVSFWQAEAFYNQIVTRCFVMDPHKRINFQDLVTVIEKQLDPQERRNYIELASQYNNEKYLVPNKMSNSSNSQNQVGLGTKNECVGIKYQIDLGSKNGYSQLPII